MNCGLCGNSGLSCECDLAEVIQMPKPTSEDPAAAWFQGPIRTKRRSHDECRHLQIEIDEKLRTVECIKCKTTLDPVSALLNFQGYWREIQNARLRMQQEREKAQRKGTRGEVRRKGAGPAETALKDVLRELGRDGMRRAGSEHSALVAELVRRIEESGALSGPAIRLLIKDGAEDAYRRQQDSKRKPR